MGREKNIPKKEAANTLRGQMVEGLERFAMEIRLHHKGNRELGKVLKRKTQVEKGKSAVVWRGLLRSQTPLVAPLCAESLLFCFFFLSQCSRSQS